MEGGDAIYKNEHPDGFELTRVSPSLQEAKQQERRDSGKHKHVGGGGVPGEEESRGLTSVVK